MQDEPYRLIPLYQHGEVVAHAKVDPADFERLSVYRWVLDATTGYPSRTEKHYLHREVLGLRQGDGISGDHVDGDLFDCRRSQLRVCPRGQADNGQNHTKLSSRNTSGYRGVTRCSKGDKWRARVSVAGREYALGEFTDPAEAGRAAAIFRAAHMPFATS